MRLRNKKVIIISVASVLAIFGLVLASVKTPAISSLLSTFNKEKPLSQEEKAKIVAEQKQYEEDKKVMKNVFSLLPKDSSQVVHANFSKVDVQSQWDNLMKMAPAIIFTEDAKTEKIPQESLKKVKSLTLSFFQGYDPEDSKESEIKENPKQSASEPFAHLMVLTTHKDDTADVYNDMSSIIDGNVARLNFFTPPDSDYGYVFAFTYPAKQQVLPIVKPYLHGDKPLEDREDSFASSGFLEKFDLKDTQPSMYYNFSKTFNTLFSYRGTEDKKSVEFLNTFRQSGLGLEGEEDVVWFGKTKDINSSHSSWVGKFVSGKINPAAINHETVNNAIVDQYVIFEPENEEPVPSDGDDPSVYMSYGYFTYGLAAIADTISIQTPRGSTGITSDQIISNDNGENEVKQTPLKADEEVVIHYSPRDLIGVFTGHDNVHQSKYLTWTIKKDGTVSLDVENS